MEIWKDISGFEGIYQVSNYGKIKNITTNKILSQSKHYGSKRKYISLSVALHKNGVRYDFIVSRIVAKEFIENKYNKPCVNHKDNNPQNNSAENLEWVSYKENSQHAITNNRWNGNKKLKESDVIFIRQNLNNDVTTLANKYKVCRKTILNVINFVYWKKL